MTSGVKEEKMQSMRDCQGSGRMCSERLTEQSNKQKKNSDFIEQTAAYRVFQYNTLEVVKLQQTPRINAAHVH